MLRIMLLGTALQGSVTVLSLSLGLKKRYFALGCWHEQATVSKVLLWFGQRIQMRQS